MTDDNLSKYLPTLCLFYTQLTQMHFFVFKFELEKYNWVEQLTPPPTSFLRHLANSTLKINYKD